MKQRQHVASRRHQSVSNFKLTHRLRKRFSLINILLMITFLACALVVILAHLQVSKKMKSLDANSNASPPARHHLKQSTPPKKEAHTDGKLSRDKINYHVIFSTTCSEQQDWESYVLFYHAWKVNQPGNVTRLASGCSPEEEKTLTEFHASHIQTMSNRFHLHFTPEYGRIRLSEGRVRYKYMNKPYSVRHWMEHVLGLNETQPIPPEIENDVIILMDPDMILLRPLTHDFSTDRVIWADQQPENDKMKVIHGNPMAQQDGYLISEWLRFNITNITQDPNTPALLVKEREAPTRWNTGPPYLATVRDMYNIAVKWTEFAPRVFDQYPKLFAEMYGFCIASAHLKLPHTMVKSIVVSTTITVREGWDFIDSIPDEQICSPPADANMPFVLHYCKRYYLERFFFSKYRLRKNYLSCETPLLTMPSPSLLEVNYTIPIPEATGKLKEGNESLKRPMLNPKTRKRELFMLCGLIGKINEAVIFFKQNHCEGNANFNETYNFHDYPFSK